MPHKCNISPFLHHRNHAFVQKRVHFWTTVHIWCTCLCHIATCLQYFVFLSQIPSCVCVMDRHIYSLALLLLLTQMDFLFFVTINKCPNHICLFMSRIWPTSGVITFSAGRDHCCSKMQIADVTHMHTSWLQVHRFSSFLLRGANQRSGLVMRLPYPHAGGIFDVFMAMNSWRQFYVILGLKGVQTRWQRLFLFY